MIGEASVLVLIMGLVGCGATSSRIYSPIAVKTELVSIVVGKITSQKHVGFPSCPENLICMDAVFTNQLGNLKTLAGPRVKTSTFHIVKHGAWPRNSMVAFAVQRAKDGKYWAVSRGLVVQGTFCLDSERIVEVDKSALAVVPPQDNQTSCFKIL